MAYTWIIENKLAQAPLPSLRDIPELADRFTGVVVLTTESEHPPTYIGRLREHGLEVLHLPTRDHHPVELLDLLRAIRFIKTHIEANGAVLVHCYGGIGRSGLTTTAYMVYNGLSAYEAVRFVRSKVYGAVENKWQMQMLENIETLVNTIERDLLNKYIENVEQIYHSSRVDYYHLSKVSQFTIEILNNLQPYLKSIDMKRTILRSLSHLHKDTLQRLVEELHRLAGDDTQDPIVSLAHAIDYAMDSSVVAIDITNNSDSVELNLLCRENCEKIVNVLDKDYRKILLYDSVLELRFSWYYYMDFV